MQPEAASTCPPLVACVTHCVWPPYCWRTELAEVQSGYSCLHHLQRTSPAFARWLKESKIGRTGEILVLSETLGMCLQGAPSVSASRRPTPPRPAPATCGARTTWCWLTGELRTDIWKSCMRRKLFLAKVTALCSSNSSWWQQVTWPWQAGNPSFSRKLTCSASPGRVETLSCWEKCCRSHKNL